MTCLSSLLEVILPFGCPAMFCRTGRLGGRGRRSWSSPTSRNSRRLTRLLGLRCYPIALTRLWILFVQELLDDDLVPCCPQLSAVAVYRPPLAPPAPVSQVSPLLPCTHILSICTRILMAWPVVLLLLLLRRARYLLSSFPLTSFFRILMTWMTWTLTPGPPVSWELWTSTLPRAHLRCPSSSFYAIACIRSPGSSSPSRP